MIYEKDNEIIVTKLRPMSEAPSRGFIIICHRDWPELCLGYRSDRDSARWDLFELGETDDESDLLGWLPIPVYKPDGERANPETNEIDKMATENKAANAVIYTAICKCPTCGYCSRFCIKPEFDGLHIADSFLTWSKLSKMQNDAAMGFRMAADKLDYLKNK